MPIQLECHYIEEIDILTDEVTTYDYDSLEEIYLLVDFVSNIIRTYESSDFEFISKAELSRKEFENTSDNLIPDLHSIYIYDDTYNGYKWTNELDVSSLKVKSYYKNEIWVAQCDYKDLVTLSNERIENLNYAASVGLIHEEDAKESLLYIEFFQINVDSAKRKYSKFLTNEIIQEREKSEERIDNMRNLDDYKQILSSLTYQFDNDLWYRKSSETCMGPSSHAGIVVSQIKNSYQQACRNISEGDTSFSNSCILHIHIDIGVVEKVREWADSCYEISDEEWEKEREENNKNKAKNKTLSNPKECNESMMEKALRLSNRNKCSTAQCKREQRKVRKLKRKLDSICSK